MKKTLLKNKGYTLIELLLYIGIVSVLAIAIFNYYNKKQLELSVYELSQELILLDEKIKGVCTTIGCTTSFGNSFLRDNKLVPDSMIDDLNIVHHVDGGGTMSFSYVPGATQSYNMSLSVISQNGCAKLATSEYARRNVTGIVINTVNVLVEPNKFSSQTVADVAANCNRERNRIIFRSRVFPHLLDPTPSTTPVRAKENPLYIPTVATTTTTAVTAGMCSGGSTWTGSFCSCPINTHWNGTTCQTLNSAMTWCRQGQGGSTDSRTCIPLPSGTPSDATYRSGRHITNIVTTAPQKASGDGIDGEIPAAGSSIIAGKTISWQAGVRDNGFTNTCVNGNWNNTLKRCVTP